MDVRPGYKQTEVGVIPEDWQAVSIGTLVIDFRGGAPLKPTDFTQTGIKVLPKGGVGRTGWLKIEDQDLQYCSSTYAASHRRNQVDKSFTIVVLRDLVPSGPSIGLMVQVRDCETFLLAQGVYGFKVNEDIAVPGYLVQLSNTRWYRRLANSIMVGSTQVHITNTAFKSAQIPLPPVVEQEAIAEALSDADALIESLEQLIAKKRQIKQGAMQELLTGNRRLNEFADAAIGYKQTEVGVIPEDWDSPELGDILKSMQLGGNYKNNERETNWPLIKMGNLGRGSIKLDKLEFIDSVKGPFSRDRLEDDDVLFNTRNTLDLVGKVAIWRNELPEAYFNSNIMRMKFDKQRVSSYRFMNYILNTSRSLRGLRDIAIGTTSVAAIYSRDLVRLKIPLPTKAEQEAIAEVLSDMDDEIAALEAKLSKARQIKQGMMHNLLTGRIRLV